MRKAVELCRDCGTEYDIPSINYGNNGSERCPNCGSERSAYIGQSKNNDADLAGMYLSKYFPIYSTWYTNENGMYVEVPVYGGDGDNATTVHVTWEQIKNDERPHFRYDNEYDSSRRKSMIKGRPQMDLSEDMTFNSMVKLQRMKKYTMGEVADADTILSWVRHLAQSQGSYGRLLEQLENDPEALQNLVDQGFTEPLEMVLYLEG